MTTKYTPGPWAVSNLLSPYGAVYVRADRNFARIYDEWKNEETQLANARLIAAAPELLQALQALVDMDVAYQRGPAVENAVVTARAAIAKATGSAA